jgi:cytochrome b pre-mRNA-processing protein 3
MLSLFKALRSAPSLSAPAYDAAVNTARARQWYIAGAVPDTMDGRFALLATVVALVSLRLEAEGDAGRSPSVALTEAFIDDMDAQMRQEGFDATLGKKVRHLVGSLASRVDRWRRLFGGGGSWNEVVRRTVYRDEPAEDAAVASTVIGLKDLRDRLAGLSLTEVVAGKWA